MAIRYSGTLTIKIDYRDSSCDYRCRLRDSSGDRITIYVGEKLEHGSGIGVDSPKMFDQVARAAIAFAEDEEPGWGECAMCDDTGYLVFRGRYAHST